MARATVVLTGAPLSVRASELVAALSQSDFDVDFLMTEAAKAWVSPDELASWGAGPRESHSSPRLPLPDLVIVCPATFNTVNKVAAGIADSRVSSFLCECVGAGTATIWVPFVNDRLWRHPAFGTSLGRLANGPGCHVLDPRTLESPAEPVRSGSGDEVVALFDPVRLVEVAQESVS